MLCGVSVCAIGSYMYDILVGVISWYHVCAYIHLPLCIPLLDRYVKDSGADIYPSIILPYSFVRFHVLLGLCIYSSNRVHRWPNMRPYIVQMFFPIIRLEHYFLLCFDFRHFRLEIIDNSSSTRLKKDKYGECLVDMV